MPPADDPSMRRYGNLPLFAPADGTTILEPESSGNGFWVGAPSVLHDPTRDRLLLTYRRRRPRGHGSERGYVARIAESGDGIHFRDIWEVQKEVWQTSSMERFCLIRSTDGRFLLYASYVDPRDNRWRIDWMEGETPEQIDPARRRAVLSAADCGRGIEGVKDPWVFTVGGLYVMLISAAAGVADPARQAEMHATADVYNTGILTAPTGWATSVDGRRWRWRGQLLGVGEAEAWDAYQTRLNCVLYRSPAWIGCYDGSASHLGNYEERTGLVMSLDLRTWERLTPDAPALTSPHGSGSLRYVDALALDGKLRFYYEYARPDGSHELRSNVVEDAGDAGR
jgi:hypothetical protein